MASTYLTRTPSSSGNRRTMTFSFWVKRSGLGYSALYGQYNSTNDNNSQIYFTNDDKLLFWDYTSPSYNLNFNTNRLFRDTNAWYHIVLAIDTTQATSSNRVKFYINGVQETSLSPETYPSQNYQLFLNENKVQTIGNFRYGSSDNYLFNGSMSHFHFIDGTQYQASDFGEFDANGVWKIKTEPSVTYGTNGFFIFKDGNSVTDQSGNSNNWTVASGTLTNTEDNPSNVFCTWNPLDNFYQESTFQYGNTEVRGKSPGTIYGYETFNTGTLGMSSGKYYWEIKVSARDGGATEIGIANSPPSASSEQLQQGTYNWSYKGSGSVVNNNSSVSGTWSSYTTGDIIGVALNLDDNELTFYKNGTVQNSGTAISITDPASTTSGFYFPAGGDENAGNVTLQANFGNGYFGTTAVASAGTNASGNGIFEYDVPTGYTALSTKGLNT